VFARTTGPCKTQRYDDGELRGDGGIVVLPPSRHPSGEIYAWSREPVCEIPIVEPSSLVGAATPKQREPSAPASSARKLSRAKSDSKLEVGDQSHAPDQTHATHQTTQAPDQTHATSGPTHHPHIACVNCYNDSLIDSAIERTLPTGYGERNRRIFEYARELRKVFAKSTDLETIRPFVEEWHRAALPNIRTKDFLVTWQDFVLAWERIILPAGARLGNIRTIAGRDPFTLGRRDTNLDNVARLFRAAALAHGPATQFYMSFRTIGQSVGLSPVACRAIAHKLVAQGLLMIVKNGTVGTRGNATVWRWLGP
jgi:hypothetical protein